MLFRFVLKIVSRFLFCSIGYVVAKRLAEDGAHVVVSSRNKDKVNKAVNKLKSMNLSVAGQVCHIGKPGEVQKLLREVGYKFHSWVFHGYLHRSQKYLKIARKYLTLIDLTL